MSKTGYESFNVFNFQIIVVPRDVKVPRNQEEVLLRIIDIERFLTVTTL